jgi:hypothetical protein
MRRQTLPPRNNQNTVADDSQYDDDTDYDGYGVDDQDDVQRRESPDDSDDDGEAEDDVDWKAEAAKAKAEA